jgi:NAD(P)-dependent dehydrogenase (short-subunit alcohol dehydrogenase family)
MTWQAAAEGKRVVLVTGASSGLGLACCERLAGEANTRVYGSSRTLGKGGPWSFFAMDVTDEASVNYALSQILEQEGRIDVVVHCAGNSLAGAVEDCSIAETAAQFDTNYLGTVRLVRAALPAMRRQQAGKIVIVGSIGGLIGLPFLAHYSATKFALDGFVEALRGELASSGIEVTILHPGDVRTAFGANRIVGEATSTGNYAEKFRRTLAFYNAAEAGGIAPDKVALEVQRLLRARRLPVRAVVGTPLEVAGTWAKRLLPGRWFEAAFRKAHSP